MSEIFTTNDQILDCLTKGEIDDAIDILFDTFDDLFMDGEFEKADELLPTIEVEKLDTNLLVALLVITYPAKEKLSNRPAVVERVKERLYEIAPDRARELLRERT